MSQLQLDLKEGKGKGKFQLMVYQSYYTGKSDFVTGLTLDSVKTKNLGKQESPIQLSRDQLLILSQKLNEMGIGLNVRELHLLEVKKKELELVNTQLEQANQHLKDMRAHIDDLKTFQEMVKKLFGDDIDRAKILKVLRA